jgi:type IV secretion system protein VirB2
MAILISAARPRALGMAAALALAAAPALAQDLSPVNDMLTTIGTALTGTTGRALGLIALAGVGIAFFTGRMPWQFAASVVFGLAIVFGAATILGGFGGAA